MVLLAPSIKKGKGSGFWHSSPMRGEKFSSLVGCMCNGLMHHHCKMAFLDDSSCVFSLC